jgi:ABC-type nitrate/sulfonate/bicarbonate transport system substrate-binding protein
MRQTGWPARILGLAAAAAVIAGCGSSGSGAGGSGSAPADAAGSGAGFATETLGTVSNLMHTDEYVAAQEGFYAQNGLNVKIKIFDSGSDVTKAMQAGTVKFGSASTTAVPAARAAGVPLKLLVGGMNDGTSSLYDGPLGIVGRADRGITTKASPLKGKRIGVLVGSTTEQYLRLYLEKNGMTEKDVTLVNLQVPDHPVSLQQGNVDAVASWEPYVSQEISELGSNAVTVSRGEGLLGYIVGLGVLDPTLQNNRALVMKFVTAVAEADAFIRKNPQKAAQDAANYLPGLNVNMAADAIKNHMKWDPRLSVCTQTAMKEGADELFKSGQITTNVPLAAMMDTSIIGQVEKAHPAWFADLSPLPASC